MRCRTVPKAAPIIHAYPPKPDNAGCQTVRTENKPAIAQATKAF